MSYILSIDQGTTSSRVILFDLSGDIVDVAQKDLQQHYPQNGWVEHDALQIWQDTKDCIAQVTKNRQMAALGITNQRETSVIWNRKTGQPIYNAIVWQDRRTADYCRTLVADGYADMVQHKTGLLIDSYFSATKIKWILDHVQGAREAAEKGELAFGTTESWLLWNLTNGKYHASDVTNACRTMLYNIHTHQWDPQLLQLFDIPETLLPQVYPNVHDYGETVINGRNVPISGMAGDQQAAVIGQTCFAPGMVKSTYGTGCFALLHTGQEAKPSQNRLLTTIAYDLGDGVHYAAEGSIFNAGTAIQWLRDGLGLFSKAQDTQKMAEAVLDTNGLYFVPAFTGLGAPYWQSDARGAFFGLTRDCTKNHIVRAALEAQAYQTRDLLGAMEKDSGIKIHNLRIDGGMVANDFVCQFLADILQVRVERPKVIETTALGAAYCAGLGAGLYKTIQELSKKWALDHVFTPAISEEEAARLYQGWQQAVARLT